MNGQRFHQQKRIEMKTEQCERSLNVGGLSLCPVKPVTQCGENRQVLH